MNWTDSPLTDDDREMFVERFQMVLDLYDEGGRVGLIDCLTDARYWCKANSVDFDQANETAQGHFEEGV